MRITFHSFFSNFYPRPPRGGRHRSDMAQAATIQFLSTPSARRATSVSGPPERAKKFLSTPSARRATGGRCSLLRGNAISIHALREEGDPQQATRYRVASYFYPRPPRGGRPQRQALQLLSGYFYPRPPRGGRLGICRKQCNSQRISIHALREEGDRERHGYSVCDPISIHALREEGDKRASK